MIIIGEKLNGSIPSVAKAIAERDADLIRERARMQAEAGATFLDVCASVEEAVEVETWTVQVQDPVWQPFHFVKDRDLLTLFPLKETKLTRFFQ